MECFIDSENFEDRMNRLAEVHSKCIARLKAVYDALNHVCSDVGLCQETFLGNSHIEEQCPDVGEYLAEDIAAEAGFMERYKQVFGA